MSPSPLASAHPVSLLRAARHWRGREWRFLAMVLTTGVVIGLHLGSSLRLAGQAGSGWRAIDLPALERRIERGDLRDREADWYHPATEEELRSQRGAP